MKVIDTGITEGLMDVITGVGSIKSIKSVKGSSRKRLIQNILYYQRKCMTLLRRLQMISESVEDDELERLYEEVVSLRENIFKEAKKMGL